MSNEATKQQVKDFFDRAIQKAKNPDKREILIKKRQEKAKTVSKRYGF